MLSFLTWVPFALLLLLPVALAIQTTAGLEFVVMYHVYKVEFLAAQKDSSYQRQMLPGKTGGLANFEDFIRYTVFPKNAANYKPGNLHATFDPDVNTGHNYYADSGGHKPQHIKANIVTNAPAQGGGWGLLIDRLQTVWSNIPNKEATAGFDTSKNTVKTCLDRALDLRDWDQAEKELEFFRNRFAGSPLVTPRTAPQPFGYLGDRPAFDWDATAKFAVEQRGQQPQDVHTAIDSAMNDLMQGGVFKNHENLAPSFKSFSSYLC